jgi:hypothetical protein
MPTGPVIAGARGPAPGASQTRDHAADNARICRDGGARRRATIMGGRLGAGCHVGRGDVVGVPVEVRAGAVVAHGGVGRRGDRRYERRVGRRRRRAWRRRCGATCADALAGGGCWRCAPGFWVAGAAWRSIRRPVRFRSSGPVGRSSAARSTARATAGGSGTSTTFSPPAANPEDAVAVFFAEVGDDRAVTSNTRSPSRPSGQTSAKSFGLLELRLAASSASNTRCVSPRVGDSAGTLGRRTYSVGEC